MKRVICASRDDSARGRVERTKQSVAEEVAGDSRHGNSESRVEREVWVYKDEWCEFRYHSSPVRRGRLNTDPDETQGCSAENCQSNSGGRLHEEQWKDMRQHMVSHHSGIGAPNGDRCFEEFL